MSRPRTSVKERFWQNVSRGSDDECWPWTGYTTSHGYGRIWDSDLCCSRRATEVSLTLAGIDVPHDAYICHECDNPSCMNPTHLYIGDATTNAQDREIRGRGAINCQPKRGESNGHAKLTSLQVIEIRNRYTGAWGEQSQLGREYKVNASTIRKIVTGKAW